MKIVISKPKKVFLFILSILAVIIISSILAYLTDKEQKQNEFTIGSIDIKLEETAWDALPDIDNSGVPDAAEAMGPGETIAKDPKVVNQGQNDAYVYLKVEVPKAEIKVAGGALERQELFTYSVHGDNWVLMPDLTIDDEDSNKITYIYYYKNGIEDYLRAGATSETLFDNVTLKDITNFNGLAMEQQIVVKAYAIQLSDEFTVTSNKWITQFTNEKTGIPVQYAEAKILSNAANSDDGYKENEDIIVGVAFSQKVYGGTNKEALNKTNAPIMTGQVGDGEESQLEFIPETEANLINEEKLAIASRANKNETILKYKYTVKPGEYGKFKILRFEGNLYSESGTKIMISKPYFSEKEEEKIKVAIPTLYSQLTLDDYGKNNIEGFENYQIFYKGPVRESETEIANDENARKENKVVLIYKGYYPNNQIPEGLGFLTKDNNIQTEYSAWWDQATVTSVEAAIQTLYDESWTTKIISNSNLITKGIKATGGVGLTTWVSSWNQKNELKIYKKIFEDNGNIFWSVNIETQNITSDDDVLTDYVNRLICHKLNATNTLYFPYNELIDDNPFNSSGAIDWLGKCGGYRLSSPGASNQKLSTIGYRGSINDNNDSDCNISSRNTALRPAIYIPENVKAIYNSETEKWEIQ